MLFKPRNLFGHKFPWENQAPKDIAKEVDLPPTARKMPFAGLALRRNQQATSSWLLTGNPTPAKTSRRMWDKLFRCLAVIWRHSPATNKTRVGSRALQTQQAKPVGQNSDGSNSFQLVVCSPVFGGSVQRPTYLLQGSFTPSSH